MIEPVIVIVIVAYRPKPGKESETLDLVRSRAPTLRNEGLVTDRAPIIMRAHDRTTRYLNPPKCLPVSNRFPTDCRLREMI
jgi:hypothetical protein